MKVLVLDTAECALIVRALRAARDADDPSDLAGNLAVKVEDWPEVGAESDLEKAHTRKRHEVDGWPRCEGCGAPAGFEAGGAMNEDEGTHACFRCFEAMAKTGAVIDPATGGAVPTDNPDLLAQIERMRARHAAWLVRESVTE